MSNKTVLWIVKIVAAIFNFPATAYVFFDILSATDRSPAFVYFNLIFAVLLIDVFFLWVLGVLEDSKEDPIKRMPAALSSILLVVAIIWIGVKDEGILAFAPRIGLVVLVFNDWILWSTDFFQLYFSRERIEKRIRDREVVHSRKIKSAARKQAMKNLKTEIIYSQEQSLIKQLSLFEEEKEPVKTEPVLLDIKKDSIICTFLN